MWDNILTYLLENHRGKLVGIVLGLIAGILVVSYGFLKALFIIICVTVGYIVGRSIDENSNFDDWMQRVFKHK